MSFSKDTKKELCDCDTGTAEEMTALCYGMTLYSRVFSFSSLTASTESKPCAVLYSNLLSSLTGTIVELSSTLTHRSGENSIYTVSVPDKNDCEKIFDHFGHSKKRISLQINRANIDNEGCLPFFLRGVFLICGNVSSPEKDYHMEFVVPHKNLAADLVRIITEIEELDAQPKTVMRKGSYIVYIKGSDSITDILTYMGAQMSSLDIIQNKMLKDVRNKVNRRINSETANINKTATASAKQLYAIRLIMEKQGLGSLPDELRELAQLRLDNPEYNLRELGAALSKPISRSGVNHRLVRIMKIAEELSEK